MAELLQTKFMLSVMQPAIEREDASHEAGGGQTFVSHSSDLSSSLQP